MSRQAVYFLSSRSFLHYARLTAINTRGKSHMLLEVNTQAWYWFLFPKYVQIYFRSRCDSPRYVMWFSLKNYWKFRFYWKVTFCTCTLLLVRTDELLPERFAALVEVELCDGSLNGWSHTISVQNYSRFDKHFKCSNWISNKGQHCKM